MTNLAAIPNAKELWPNHIDSQYKRLLIILKSTGSKKILVNKDKL